MTTRIAHRGLAGPILRRPVITFAVSALALVVGFLGSHLLFRTGLYPSPTTLKSSMALVIGAYWVIWATLISVSRSNPRVLRFLPRLFMLPFGVLMAGAAWMRLTHPITPPIGDGSFAQGLGLAAAASLVLALAFTPTKPFVIHDSV